MKRFKLPENAKMNQVKASMENGVLTVTIPKEEVKKLEIKSIDISGLFEKGVVLVFLDNKD
ncbi:hypothetical protein ACSBR2_032721 [Camellia fascicularis]